MRIPSSQEYSPIRCALWDVINQGMYGVCIRKKCACHYEQVGDFLNPANISGKLHKLERLTQKQQLVTFRKTQAITNTFELNTWKMELYRNFLKKQNCYVTVCYVSPLKMEEMSLLKLTLCLLVEATPSWYTWVCLNHY